MTWDPVVLDCHGNPEPNPAAIVYVLTQVLKEPSGFIRRCYDGACWDDVTYYPPVLARVDETPTPEWPDAEVYIPARGGVTFFEVAARDEAGNVSVEECQ